MPPLLTMERAAFRVILAGFGVPHSHRVTGIAFSETLFSRAMKFDTDRSSRSPPVHSSGRCSRPLLLRLRGRTALRWTLADSSPSCSPTRQPLRAEVILQRAAV